MVRTFAVIGDPIERSMSPNIHNAAFRELGMDATYIAYRIPRGELEEGIESLKKISVAGFNVTIPHKVDMMRFLDRTDESCSVTGAANTVANEDGTLKGYNTDMDGFLDPIRKRDIRIRGTGVLLLGAGGAARAIIAGFAKEGAERITVANRTVRHAEEAARFARSLGPEACAVATDRIPDLAGYRFVVNATPAGSNGEPAPVDTEQLTRDTVVYDIVYMPMNTDLIKGAKVRGAPVIFGYEMLLGQATRAFEIWHKRPAPYEAMRRALVGAGGR